VRKKLIITILAAIAAWVIVAPLLAAYLIVERPLDHADAIIVLSGSAVYKERIAHAAKLFRERRLPVIYITNDGERSGWSEAEQRNIPYVELEQRELFAAGVPVDSVRVLPGVVSGTDDEARAMAAETDAAGLRSVLIVTSAYHSRRSLRAFERIFAGKGVELGIAPAPLTEDSPTRFAWWLHPAGWRMVAGEYVKSAVYWAYS
jgi:uncharacterized SAM-binding protein YcdF (DUF218 family)